MVVRLNEYDRFIDNPISYSLEDLKCLIFDWNWIHYLWIIFINYKVFSVLEYNCLNKVCYSVNQNVVKIFKDVFVGAWITETLSRHGNQILLGHLLLSICKEGEIYRNTIKFNYRKCATTVVKKINLPAKCTVVFSLGFL